MVALFWFTVRQTLLQRKIWVTLLLLLGPCALTLLIRHFKSEDDLQDVWERFHASMQFVLFLVVLPLICMLFGTSLIGAEVESRTLVYLLTRKMRRATVLVVRFAAVALVLSVLMELTLLAQYGCAVGGVDVAGLESPGGDGAWQPLDELLCYLRAGPAGVVAFLAAFVLIGLLVSRPLSISIVYVIVVELIISNLPVGVRVYTVSHQLRKGMFHSIPGLASMYELSPDQVAEFFPPGSTGTWAVCGLVLAALLVGGVLMTTRELVPAKIGRE
ncbi:MAG TPA: ABC transporter permease [Phycisphaerae bacterium]|nr:ABC transporter permease [Phycisphaerae bacterium]